MRQGLSELAHECMAIGVLGPIQLIGRRRVEYPLVQDTNNIVLSISMDYDLHAVFSLVQHFRSLENLYIKVMLLTQIVNSYIPCMV